MYFIHFSPHLQKMKIGTRLNEQSQILILFKSVKYSLEYIREFNECTINRELLWIQTVLSVKYTTHTMQEFSKKIKHP